MADESDHRDKRPRRDLNSRPLVYKTSALTTELRRRNRSGFHKSMMMIDDVNNNHKSYSPTGNRTLVSRVTGGDTHHYTIEDVNTVNRFRCVWFSNLLCIEMDVFYNKCKIMAIYRLNWSTLSLMNEWINDDKDWTNVLMLWFVLNIFCNGKSSPEVRVATNV